MREYKNTEARMLARIVCNSCGKIIAVENGVPVREVCRVRKAWGYFSGKDGETDEFDLCEDCYDRITEQFLVSVTKTEATELL